MRRADLTCQGSVGREQWIEFPARVNGHQDHLQLGLASLDLFWESATPEWTQQCVRG